MKAYSMDLRERVVTACDEGVMTHSEIVETFQVSTAWIRRLLQRRRECGSYAPKPHGGGRASAYQGESAELLVQAMKDHTDATLKQLAKYAGLTCSTTARFRKLKKLGITQKNKDGKTGWSFWATLS